MNEKESNLLFYEKEWQFKEFWAKPQFLKKVTKMKDDQINYNSKKNNSP